MSISERSVTCSFFQELYSHTDKNSKEKSFEYMFLVKIASNGTVFVKLPLLLFTDHVTYCHSDLASTDRFAA